MTESVLVPDGIVPVVGWRGWRLSIYSAHSYLKSPTFPGHWSPNQPHTATCNDPSLRATQVGATYVPPTQDILELHSQRHRVHSVAKRDYDLDQWYVELAGKQRLVVPRPLPETYAVPARECWCGVHLASDRAEADNYAQGSPSFPGGPRSEFGVLGRCAGWGIVIQHELGWRVQYAYPQSFYVDDADFDVLSPVLKEWGVPVMRRSLLNGEATSDPERTPQPVATGGVIPAPTARSMWQRLLANGGRVS